jgi:sortase (surface protein transpeptidase)
MRVAAAALLALAVVGCGTSSEPAAELASPAPTAVPAPTPEPEPEPTPEPEREPAPAAAPVPDGAPARVVIPAIDVDAELVPVGLDGDGAMDVPDFGLAGWYTEGPAPGHPGPAAIAAHVDSRAGPDVFYRLRELAPGDEVHVTYDSGDEVSFVVRGREQAPKDELPGDRIWPVTSDRLLTLITCGGDFDRGVRSYQDNVIVYTDPLESDEAADGGRAVTGS